MLISRDDVDVNVNLNITPSYAPLVAAINFKMENMVRVLLDGGAELKNCAEIGSILHIAAANAFSGIVRLLLEHGADIEARILNNIKGQTSLLCALAQSFGEFDNYMKAAIAMADRRGTLELLDEYGANLYATDSKGGGGLDAAADSCSFIGLEWLLGREDFDINVRNLKGQTLMFRVVKRPPFTSGNEGADGYACLEHLLEMGTRADLIDDD